MRAIRLETPSAGPAVHELTGGTVAFVTRCSPLRAHNEDGGLVLELPPLGTVLVVVDGAGGLPGSERAAEVALAAFEEATLASPAEALRERVLAGIEHAHARVAEMRVGAGTTLAAVTIREDRARSFHAGDSGVLLFGQRGRRKFESIAHSPVGYAVEAGLLSEDDALHHEERHIVSNLVGAEGFRVDMSGAMSIARRDTLLLASDGLLDNLHASEIVELARTGPLTAGLERLTTKARERMATPGPDLPSKPDDLTVIAYRRSA